MLLMTGTTAAVRENTAHERFELVLDDKIAGEVTYRQHNDVMVLVHTEIADGHSGQGLGSKLARGVFDILAERGDTVRLECPFLIRWVDKHPEYASSISSG